MIQSLYMYTWHYFCLLLRLFGSMGEDSAAVSRCELGPHRTLLMNMSLGLAGQVKPPHRNLQVYNYPEFLSEGKRLHRLYLFTISPKSTCRN